jgi:hypothetical protein
MNNEGQHDIEVATLFPNKCLNTSIDYAPSLATLGASLT